MEGLSRQLQEKQEVQSVGLAKEVVLHLLGVGSPSQKGQLLDGLLKDLQDTSRWKHYSLTRQQLVLELLVDGHFTDQLLSLVGSDAHSLLEELVKVLLVFSVRGVQLDYLVPHLPRLFL